MMLCLDCGNTRLKWGLRDGDEWQAQGALPATDIAQLVRQLPRDRQPSAIIGCNVADETRRREIETVLAASVRWVLATASQCGVTNAYDNPASLGADRWAALIGARAMHDGAAVVVLAGTATTIDVLDAAGQFCGGLILPGIDMMTHRLAGGTANLPLSRGAYRTLPRNTHDAIASGAIHATLGAITRMYSTLAAHAPPLCLLSGGAADRLQPHLDLPLRRIDNLVLEGLVRIAVEPVTRPPL